MYNTIPIFKFPKGKELTTFLKDILEEEVDEKYYMTEKQLRGLEKYEERERRYNIFGNTYGVGYSPRTREFGVTGWRKHIIPTLCQRDYKDPKYLKIKNATKKGYLEAKEGDGIVLDNPNSKIKRGRVKSGISGTLTCAGSDGVITRGLSIRKLTPTEYCRLQGFPDDWNDNVSNNQRYKQMGNAISVPVVKALFNNLLIGKTKST